MPFTPTHALAVVPLQRLLPLTALAIGAMVPDFPLFFPVGIAYETTHRAAGVAGVCLPLGLALYLLVTNLVWEPVIALAPAWWRRRLWRPAPRASGARGLAKVALAILVGAGSHVVWDAFTHQGRWGVEWLGALNQSYQLGPLQAHGYNLFQHGSSLVGLPLLAMLAWRAAATRPPRAPDSRVPEALRLGAIGVLLVVAGGRALLAAAAANPNLHDRLYELVTVGGRWFMSLLLLWAMLFQIHRRWASDNGRLRAP